MNLKPSKWFWTQYLVVIGFISIYIIMSLTPWYFSMYFKGDTENKTVVEEAEPLNRELVTPYSYDAYGEPINSYGERINEYGDVISEMEEVKEDLVAEEEEEPKQSFRMAMMQRMNEGEEVDPDLTDFQKRYVNEGKMTSLDLLIVVGYLISISYVLGMFLTSIKSAILVNVPVLVLMIFKMVGILRYKDVYQTSLKNILIWWVCLIIYYVLFFIHDRVVVTDIEE